MFCSDTFLDDLALAPSEVHLFVSQAAEPWPHEGSASPNERWASAPSPGRLDVRWWLHQLFRRPEYQAEIDRGSLGRPVSPGGGLWFDVSRDGAHLLIALSRLRVAASVQHVAAADDEHAHAVLTVGERRLAEVMPSPVRASFVTRLWTRKDAALRLCGRSLTLAGQVDARTEGGRGPVLVPGDCWTGDVSAVYLHDVLDLDGACGAVATADEACVTRVWPIDYGSMMAPQPAAAGAAGAPVSTNPLSSRQISAAGL